VLTDPTMGGVSASFAMIGDVVIAEPGALIGFAGPRVIEQTVKQTLPEGFQHAEFLLDKGAVDMIVDRREMRDRLAQLITLLMRLPRFEPTTNHGKSNASHRGTEASTRRSGAPSLEDVGRPPQKGCFFLCSLWLCFLSFPSSSGKVVVTFGRREAAISPPGFPPSATKIDLG
jgi:hypothetical protein